MTKTKLLTRTVHIECINFIQFISINYMLHLMPSNKERIFHQQIIFGVMEDSKIQVGIKIWKLTTNGYSHQLG